jgi:hypothetical protein
MLYGIVDGDEENLLGQLWRRTGDQCSNHPCCCRRRGTVMETVGKAQMEIEARWLKSHATLLLACD